MPKQKRVKTDYPGVYYIEGTSTATGKHERIYYIYYWKEGKKIEEKAGRQIEDAMTPARANALRADRISGKSLSNADRRAAKRQQENAIIWTLSKLWEEYKANKPLTKSVATDENRFKKHILPVLGHKQLKELAPLDLDRLRINLGKTLKPQTVKHVLGLIKRLSNFGISRRLCEGIGFKITVPKVSNLKTEDLSPEQMKKLLEAIEKKTHPHAGDMMRLALYTGMRRSEMFKLTWEDIDFQRNFIRLREPKGGDDQPIPMNEFARQLLLNRPRFKDSPYVFPGRQGKELVDINHALAEIKRASGLPRDFRALHGLRHVFASMLASSGQVDLYTLQKLLTHKSPVMTQRYAHLRDESLKRASALAGELLNETVQQKKSKCKKVAKLKPLHIRLE
jgi:integrase